MYIYIYISIMILGQMNQLEDKIGLSLTVTGSHHQRHHSFIHTKIFTFQIVKTALGKLLVLKISVVT